jgi:two-component system, NarL family, response regulator NreC
MKLTVTDSSPENRHIFTLSELKVLQLASDGHTNKDIASALLISVRAVETRRASMMLKSGTKNAASLIKFAVKNRLVT